LASVTSRGARPCIDRDPKLFSKAEIIPVIPDLRDPPVRKAKDVRGGEADTSTASLNAAPRSGMGACGRPAPNNKVPFPDDQINRDLKIGEGGAKVIGDLLLPRRTGQRLDPGRRHLGSWAPMRRELGDLPSGRGREAVAPPLHVRRTMRV
jgi:hypothetical protein